MKKNSSGKKNLLIVAVIIIVVLAIGGVFYFKNKKQVTAPQKSNSSSELLEVMPYEDKINEFSIRIPKDWIVDKNTRIVDRKLTLYSPIDKKGQAEASMGIFVRAANGADPEDLISEALKNLDNGNTDSKLIEKREVNITGKKGYVVIKLSIITNIETITTAFLVSGNDRVYYVIGDTSAILWDKYKKIFEAVQFSFKPL